MNEHIEQMHGQAIIWFSTVGVGRGGIRQGIRNRINVSEARYTNQDSNSKVS